MPSLGRLFFANLPPFLLALAAMLTLADGPVDWVRTAFGVTACGDDHCKMLLRFGTIAMVVIVKFGSDILEHQFPLSKLRDFRRKYLDEVLEPIRDDVSRHLGSTSVRFNIMVPRRCWWLLGARTLSFEHSLNFEPPKNHHDHGLWLLKGQGVAGQALRLGEPVYWHFLPSTAQNQPKGHWPFNRPWRLFSFQLKRTSHVRWIHSVPMYRTYDGAKAKVVGVINLDITDESAAGKLASDTTKICALGDQLLKVGRLASYLY